MIHPLRRLAQLEQEVATPSGYTGPTRWMIPYADLMTVLLGLFVLMFATLKTPVQTVSAPKTTPKAPVHTAQPSSPSGEKKTATSHVDQAMQVIPSPEARDLQTMLASELHLDGQQVTVSQDARGIVISFQERIFFEPGQATLTPEAEKTLDKLGRVLAKTTQPIRIEGHTDDSPIQTDRFPSNWELSTARATVIVRNLVETHQFTPQRLSAAGYGEFFPLAENSSIEGKRKNRRVDIVLLNPWPLRKADPPNTAP